MGIKVRLSGVMNDSIVDGYGIRMAVFTQGCPHHCKGCHNPTTHDFSGGYEEAIDILVQKCRENPLLKGITLSGGEPFSQAEALILLCDEVHAMGRDVWAYSGYTYEQLIADVTPYSSELLKRVDVLVDGRFIEEQLDLTLWYRGSANQRVIDMNKTRVDGGISIISFDE